MHIVHRLGALLRERMCLSMVTDSGFSRFEPIYLVVCVAVFCGSHLRQDAIIESLDDRVVIDVEMYIPRGCCDGVSDADDMYNEGNSKCHVVFSAEGADCFGVPWCHA